MLNYSVLTELKLAVPSARKALNLDLPWLSSSLHVNLDSRVISCKRTFLTIVQKGLW